MKAPTSLEFALLGLIEQRPISGYDLCKVFETTPMGHYSSSPGSIYPALKRLEKRGFIGSMVDREQSLRPRRLYVLQGAGRDELVRWVSQPVTRSDIVWAQDELLLRFSFMDALVEHPVIENFLEQLASCCEIEIRSLQKHHQGMRDAEQDGDPPPSGRLALGYGIESYKTLVRWAKKSLAEFRASGMKHGEKSL